MSISLEELRKKSTGKRTELSCTDRKNNGLALLEEMSSKTAQDLEDRIASISSKIIKETSKKFHEQKVELLFILDKSFSCKGTELAVCGSYNQLMSKEKKLGFPTMVTNVLFDERIHEISFHTEIEKIKPLNYIANGEETAIYDAIGYSTDKILNLQKQEKNPTNKTLVAIMTDGIDNSSCRYNQAIIRRLIESAQGQGWEFIFLGATLESCKEGLALGIPEENIALISMSEKEMNSNFDAIEKAIMSLRKTGKVNSSWKNEIQTMCIEEQEEQKKLRLEMK